MRLVDASANVLIPARASGLPRDSVANVSQLITMDRGVLTERIGRLSKTLVSQVDDGLRLVLSL